MADYTDVTVTDMMGNVKISEAEATRDRERGTLAVFTEDPGTYGLQVADMYAITGSPRLETRATFLRHSDGNRRHDFKID